MNRGVRRDAIEPENLVKPESQEVFERGPLLPRGIGPAGDQAVQRGLPPDHATDQFMAKPPVSRGQMAGGQRCFQQIFSKFATIQALR